MKKICSITLTCILCMALTAPVFAYNYNFGSGPDSGSTFGKPTSNDEPVSPDPMSTNTRRNKDAAHFPPRYGVFSGDIPTDPSSLYHYNEPDGGTAGSSGATIYGLSGIGGVMPPDSGAGFIVTTSDMLMSSSVTADLNIAPLYYDDGSIGTLYIPKLNKTILVFEGESLENMKKGIGHFRETSAWDGNCAFAGHNRGAVPHFAFVKDIEIGDTVVYTTKYGTRTYQVFYKDKISETDYSSLGWMAENIITMITCVENVPNLRWCVQAREVKLG